MSESCLRIAGRRCRRPYFRPDNISNHLRFRRPRPYPTSLAGVSYTDRWVANRSLRASREAPVDNARLSPYHFSLSQDIPLQQCEPVVIPLQQSEKLADNNSQYTFEAELRDMHDTLIVMKPDLKETYFVLARNPISDVPQILLLPHSPQPKQTQAYNLLAIGYWQLG